MTMQPSAMLHEDPSHPPTEHQIENIAKHWSYWQPDVPFQSAPDSRPDGQPERRRFGQPRKTISLSKFDPNAKPFSVDDPEKDAALLVWLRQSLSIVRDRFAAEKRQKVLIVVQGTDAAATGEVIRDLFDASPAPSLRIAQWPVPNDTTRDYLWHFHQQVPAAGEIVVFHRGHYAELLAPMVNDWVPKAEIHQRIGHINDFERMLSHTGTVILKFMLHVGPTEHHERLKARWRDPEQCTSLCTSDFDTVNQWEGYQRAYETMLSATHTAWAPWTVVPSNNHHHRNLMMAVVLQQVLGNLEN